MVFVFQKVFTNTIFYQILVFGDTNVCLLPHRACCNRQRHIPIRLSNRTKVIIVGFYGGIGEVSRR